MVIPLDFTAVRRKGSGGQSFTPPAWRPRSLGSILVESGTLEEPTMSRALLVIDVQNEYFTGALPITHPAGHLEQILKVMDAAAGRIPTVVVQQPPFTGLGSRLPHV
jgi:hypothetical protein